MGITIEITEHTESRHLGSRARRCAACGATEADAFLRWRLRRALGMSVKSTMIRTEYICVSCRAVSTGPAEAGCAPPWLHRYGGWLMVAAPFVAGALVLALVIPSPARAHHDPATDRARALLERREQIRKRHEEATKECEAKVASAIKTAFPRGLGDLTIRGTQAPFVEDGSVPREVINRVPRALGILDRPRTCPLATYPSEMNTTSFEAVAARYAHYEAIVEKYADEVNRIVPPPRFYVADLVSTGKHDLGVVALVTIDGTVEKIARARDPKDDLGRIGAALNRQIAGWRKP